MIPAERQCSTCREVKPLQGFSPDKTRDDYQRQCKSCRAEYMRKYNARNREQVNLKVRLRKRGITADEFYALNVAQDGACAICGRTDRPLDIDHSHETGKVRGLLCGPCNRGIGFLDDNVNILAAAIEYLGA